VDRAGKKDLPRAAPLGAQRRNVTYKPRRGVNDVSVLSKSRYRRSLSRNKAVNLANAGLIEGRGYGSGPDPCAMHAP
jgi:hypothetical protein